MELDRDRAGRFPKEKNATRVPVELWRELVDEFESLPLVLEPKVAEDAVRAISREAGEEAQRSEPVCPTRVGRSAATGACTNDVSIVSLALCLAIRAFLPALCPRNLQLKVTTIASFNAARPVPLKPHPLPWTNAPPWMKKRIGSFLSDVTAAGFQMFMNKHASTPTVVFLPYTLCTQEPPQCCPLMLLHLAALSPER